MQSSNENDSYASALNDLWGRRQWVSDPRIPPYPALGKTQRFPDFLIIGAQKAGSTWLHVNLSYHPELWCSPVKELNYFNELFVPSEDGWEDISRRTQAEEAQRHFRSLNDLDVGGNNKVRSLDVFNVKNLPQGWYETYFSFAGVDQLCGESTVDYCILPRQAIAYIVSKNPSIKILFMVRDPIERAWSQLRMMHELKYADISLDEMVAREKCPDFVAQGNYPSIITKWRATIAVDKFKCIVLDEVQINPEKTLREVCNFLGIHFDARFFPQGKKKIFEGRTIEVSPQIYEVLRVRLKPIYDDLASVIPEAAEIWTNKHFSN